MATKKQEHEHADMTNPDHLKAHGLKLVGRDIVIDDGSGVVLGQISDEDAARAGIK
jgi:hypothetical protein